MGRKQQFGTGPQKEEMMKREKLLKLNWIEQEVIVNLCQAGFRLINDDKKNFLLLFFPSEDGDNEQDNDILVLSPNNDEASEMAALKKAILTLHNQSILFSTQSSYFFLPPALSISNNGHVIRVIGSQQELISCGFCQQPINVRDDLELIPGGDGGYQAAHFKRQDWSHDCCYWRMVDKKNRAKL